MNDTKGVALVAAMIYAFVIMVLALLLLTLSYGSRSRIYRRRYREQALLAVQSAAELLRDVYADAGTKVVIERDRMRMEGVILGEDSDQRQDQENPEWGSWSAWRLSDEYSHKNLENVPAFPLESVIQNMILTMEHENAEYEEDEINGRIVLENDRNEEYSPLEEYSGDQTEVKVVSGVEIHPPKPDEAMLETVSDFPKIVLTLFCEGNDRHRYNLRMIFSIPEDDGSKGIVGRYPIEVAIPQAPPSLIEQIIEKDGVMIQTQTKTFTWERGTIRRYDDDEEKEKLHKSHKEHEDGQMR